MLILPLIVSFVLTLLLLTVESQDRVWTRLAGSTKGDAANGVAVDQTTGAVYLVGYASLSVNGEPFVGGQDIIVLKYDSDGLLVWTRMVGTASNDAAFAVAVDSTSGEVYQAGYCSGDLHGETHLGNGDITLMKFSSDGTRQWTRFLGTSGTDRGNGVAVDSSTGAIYITGNCASSMDEQTSAGGSDIVLSKFAPDGTKQWTRLAGNAGYDAATAVAVDPTTHLVYVTGYTYDGLNGQTPLGGQDIVLLNYAADGTLLWTQQVGSAGNDQPNAIAVDPTTHLVHVAGTASNALYGASLAGGSDFFVMQFSAAGGLVWTKMAGSAGTDRAFGVAVSATSGNVYVTGYLSGSVDGQPFNGVFDIAVVMFASNGTKVWVRMDGTTKSDVSSAIALSRTGELYVAGYTADSLHGEVYLASTDIFVSKYSTNEPPPVAASTSTTACQYRTFRQVGSLTNFTTHRCFKVTSN